MILETILGDSRRRQQVGVKFPRDDAVTPTPGQSPACWSQPAVKAVPCISQVREPTSIQLRCAEVTDGVATPIKQTVSSLGLAQPMLLCLVECNSLEAPRTATQVGGSLSVHVNNTQHAEVTISKAVSCGSPCDSFTRPGCLECVDVLAGFSMSNFQAGT